MEHISETCRQPCEPNDSGCETDGTPTFHAVSCSSWTLWTRKNNVYSCVTSWHKLSCCVVHGPVECIHTISTHHQRPAEACFAKLRRDIEAIQPPLTRCHRVQDHVCVPPKQSTLVSQRTMKLPSNKLQLCAFIAICLFLESVLLVHVADTYEQ